MRAKKTRPLMLGGSAAGGVGGSSTVIIRYPI